MRTWKIVVVGSCVALLAACGGSDDTGNNGNNGPNNGANNGANNGPNNGANNGPNNGANNGPNNGANNGPNNGGDCFQLADGKCVQETFRNPTTLEPDDNGVHHLELAPTEVSFGGQRHCVRAYNGAYGGPLIDTPARQGDAKRSVRVDLVNGFLEHDTHTSVDDCTCEDVITGLSCDPAHDPCSRDTCVCVTGDGAKCHAFDFNVTNLHAHGSHTNPDYARGGGCTPYTAPDGQVVQCRACATDGCDEQADQNCYFSDDVLSTVHPGEGAQFRWDIDVDHTHHEGIHWYHPHIHGTTAIQVAAGAAGPWIVRGPLDEVPGIKNARERVMVFSTPPIDENGFEPLPDGVACDEAHITFNDSVVLGATDAKQRNLINGLDKPRLVMAPGQIERWRLLHAGFLDEVFFGIFKGTDSDCTSWNVDAPVQLVQFARDGVTMEQTYSTDYMFMSPGYRIEAVLDGNALADGDTLCLASARFLQESDGPDGFSEERTGITELPTPQEIKNRLLAGELVAIVNVAASAGTPTETNLPDWGAVAALAPSTAFQGVSAAQRCEAAAAVTDPTQIDQVAILQVGAFTADDPDPCGCPNYNVNCRNFELTDRSRYPFDRDLPLGQVEHWRVAASYDGHPFHIHINPFLVCPHDSPFDPPFAHLRDTYLVNLDRKIDLIQQYETFTGGFVFHCHKLTHEDHGMMQLLRVCDGNDPTCGDYGWQECDDDDGQCVKAVAATRCAISADPLECARSLDVCRAARPSEACATTTQCLPPATCIDEVCLLPTGAPCGGNAECASGACTDPPGPPPPACE